MQYKINTDPKKMIGKRPNLAEEESVTDNIVSALSVPPEDMPLPPLSKELFLLFLRILLPARSEMLLKSPPHPQWKYLLILNTVIS